MPVSQLPEVARDARDQARQRVDQLRARQTECLANIESLADEMRAGKPSRITEMSAIAGEKGNVDKALAEAEDDFELAEQRLASATAEADRKRFNLVVAELKMRRAEFSELLRAGCLLLGKIILLKGEAGQLAQSQITTVGPITSPIVYKDPFIQSALEEVNRPLPAASDFTAGVGPDSLVPDMHLGWRTEVKICPLNSKGDNNNGK